MNYNLTKHFIIIVSNNMYFFLSVQQNRFTTYSSCRCAPLSFADAFPPRLSSFSIANPRLVGVIMVTKQTNAEGTPRTRISISNRSQTAEFKKATAFEPSLYLS